MPSQPAWFHRLDEILALLRGFDTRYLDRQAGREAVERYAAAAQFIGLSATRTGGVRAVCSELRDSVPAPAENGPNPNLESGTTLGAGQARVRFVQQRHYSPS